MIEAAFLAGFNHLLNGANWARARLSPYAGRRAALVVPPLRLGFVIAADGFCTAATADESPDVIVHLPADTPLRLLQGLDRVMAGARVEGNAEFATALSFVFRNLRWDAEEDLSRLVGDVAAHRLVATAGRLAAWQQRSVANLGENLAEYLTLEKPLLVSRQEFASFCSDLARLNADLNRLEARSKTIA